MWHKIIRIIEMIAGIAAAAGIIAGVAQLFEKKTNNHKPKGLYEKFFKRFFDAFLSTGALIVMLEMGILKRSEKTGSLYCMFRNVLVRMRKSLSYINSAQ